MCRGRDLGTRRPCSSLHSRFLEIADSCRTRVGGSGIVGHVSLVRTGRRVGSFVWVRAPGRRPKGKGGKYSRGSYPGRSGRRLDPRSEPSPRRYDFDVTPSPRTVNLYHFRVVRSSPVLRTVVSVWESRSCPDTYPTFVQRVTLVPEDETTLTEHREPTLQPECEAPERLRKVLREVRLKGFLSNSK